MTSRFSRAWPAIVLAGMMLGAGTTQAQIAVVDPTGLTQQILAGARQIQQLANDATMIQNQITSLQNQAKNLQQLPTSFSGKYQALTADLGSILAQANQITTTNATLTAQFQAAFPSDYTSSSLPSMLAQQQTNVAGIRDGIQAAYTMQAAQAANVAAHQQITTDALSASHGATGTTSAVQANTELLANLSTQLAELGTSINAQSRMAADRQALDMQREQQADQAHTMLWTPEPRVAARPAIPW